MPSATLNKAKTRKELIDPALLRAGWNVNNPDQVDIGIPVDGFDPAAWQSLERQLRQRRIAYEIPLPSGVSGHTLNRGDQWSPQAMGVKVDLRAMIDRFLRVVQNVFLQ